MVVGVVEGVVEMTIMIGIGVVPAGCENFDH
jgi:hypothetical protein